MVYLKITFRSTNFITLHGLININYLNSVIKHLTTDDIGNVPRLDYKVLFNSLSWPWFQPWTNILNSLVNKLIENCVFTWYCGQLSQWECELSTSLYGEIENSTISRSKILNLYSKWLVKIVLLCCEHDIFISSFK